MQSVREKIERFEVSNVGDRVRVSISDGLAILHLSRDDAVRIATAILVAAESATASNVRAGS